MAAKKPARSAKAVKKAATKNVAKKVPAKKVAKKRVVTKAPAKKSAARKVAARSRKATAGTHTGSASVLIDRRIAELDDWRGRTLARVRRIIKAADPGIVEEWKWGIPVWSHDGIVCTGETYKNVVKLTFPKGASLEDPAGLFNSSLEGRVRRAIDIREGEKIDEAALEALIRAAVASNEGGKAGAARAKKPKLLAGDNPQIPKGEGDAPVQAYIAAIPDWKREVARRIDALVERAVPGVRKAVKWNSPFYGVEGRDWFLSFHCFTHYVKVTFFRGTSLSPVPPGESKHKEVRYLDIRKEGFDEAQFTRWVKQASRLPGERM